MKKEYIQPVMSVESLDTNNPFMAFSIPVSEEEGNQEEAEGNEYEGPFDEDDTGISGWYSQGYLP